jgi:HEPN domain-containing protein
MTARADEARQLLAAARRDGLAFDILAGNEWAPVEIALFLAQQSIEKTLKAMLALRGVSYRRTHDLLLLESLATDAGLVVPVAHDVLARLGPYAVGFRYLGAAAPGIDVPAAEARSPR